MFERTPIIAFVGKRGDGKTLLMTIFSKARVDDGDALFANYGVKIPRAHYMDLDFLRSFFDTKGEAFLHGQNATICIDEIALFIDSHDWKSKKAKIFSYFVAQTRKRGVCLFYTTQRMNMVPNRIRDNTDLIIMPRLDKKTDTLHYSIIEYDPDKGYGNVRKELSISNVSRFYPLYDTQERIQMLEDE